MRPSSAKAKGRRLQDYVRGRILSTFQKLEDDDVKTAIMGESGEDIHLSPAARKLFPFSTECKNQESLNIWKALDQAKENAPEGSTPIVVFKRNRSETFVAMEFDHLLSLLYEHRDEGGA